MSNWLSRLLRKISHKSPKGSESTRVQPEILRKEEKDRYFNRITIKDITPDESTIDQREFIVVIYKEQPYWALFKCPCGCKTTISLPLQKVKRPYWEVEITKNNRPTIYPSIWQNNGCYSHFWVTDGIIYWCKNTGVEPWFAEPLDYSKPNKKNN